MISVGKSIKLGTDKEVAEFIFDVNLTERVFTIYANDEDLEISFASNEEGTSFGWIERISYETFKEKVQEYKKIHTRILEP
jgi:hypothetical protein